MSARFLEAMPQVLEALRLAARINPFGSVENAKAREAAVAALEAATGHYNLARIAWEVERTAVGDAFYGNALRVAKDIPGLTPDDRALLDRFATGSNGGMDHVQLQTLAMKIDGMRDTTTEAA